MSDLEALAQEATEPSRAMAQALANGENLDSLIQAWEHNNTSVQKWHAEVRALHSKEIQRLTEERDEADRRAGAAERTLGAELEDLRDTARKRAEWLREAKKRAGYEDHVSFDKVFADLLTAAEENERLREAMTPSGATKAAYISEFSVKIPEFDEDGEEYMRSINVPWVTIKEIMAAISARAALKGGE